MMNDCPNSLIIDFDYYPIKKKDQKIPPIIILNYV